jgi:hypothetical protein
VPPRSTSGLAPTINGSAPSTPPGRNFAANDDVGGLKSNLIGIGVIGAAIAALVAWDR